MTTECLSLGNSHAYPDPRCKLFKDALTLLLQETSLPLRLPHPLPHTLHLQVPEIRPRIRVRCLAKVEGAAQPEGHASGPRRTTTANSRELPPGLVCLADLHIRPGAFHSFRTSGDTPDNGQFKTLWGLHPLRSTFMVSLNIVRSLFPAFRGYSQVRYLPPHPLSAF